MTTDYTNVALGDVVVVFTALNIPTAELMVYDGLDARTDRLRWSCLRCGGVLPPPMYMARGGALVTFRSPTGLAASGVGRDRVQRHFNISWI